MKGAGGWSPLVSDSYQWLDVDLGRRTSIAAVATQGRYGSSDWLTAYLLMFSDSGHNWRQHRQEDSLGALPGNSNADSVVQYKLEKPVIARFLRLVPLDWNPTGRIGLRLEVYGCPYSSDVVHFDGTGALVFRLAARPSAAAAETFTLKFKSQKNSGTVLHAEGHGDHGDHRLSLELDQGRLQLYHQQAVTSLPWVLLASVGSLLDDQHWHYVKLERVKNHLNLTVDYTTHLVHLPNQLSHWDVHQVSVGSTLAFGLQGPVLSSKNLSGCLENLLYNSLNLIELAKKTNPQVSVIGNVTFSCSEPASVAVTFGDPLSFLSLPLPRALPGAGSGLVAVEMQIRTWDRKGLLVTFDLSEFGVWLYVSGGRIKLLLRTSQRPLLELSAGSGLSDGQWHSVSLSLGLDSVQVSVDQSEGSTAHITAAVTLSDRTQLHFGGCPSEQSAPQCSNPFGAFQGCMRLLSLNAQTVDLIQLQQRIMGNYSHLQIDMCGIIDR
uniref:Uncharacterized protein n=1 Tax=Knipowitschia caucasica TaxID=637954 RepID=A0AAV2L1D4_KNICA